jgi:hypothetical protein
MKNGKIWAGVYVVTFLLYAIFSFSLTPPNLVYFGGNGWFKFQEFMWEFGLNNRQTLTLIFSLLVGAMFVAYLKLNRLIKQEKVSKALLIKILTISGLVLIFSNPALSYDLFNYIFNAKMLVIYGADPHNQVALDFPNDPYLRFMHNTHTPAPYGYGWTWLSTIPYWLGFGRLKLEMVAMKLFIGIFFVALLLFQKKIIELKEKEWLYQVSLFALNPLVLVETFGNGHNDVVMMALALGSVYFVLKAIKERTKLFWLIAIILLAISISIKLATVVLVGSMGVYIFGKIKKTFSLGAINSVALMTPLVTIRSQRYLPWYLIWSLSFLPLIKEERAKNFLIVASMAAMESYIPYLLIGDYTQGILWWRTFISFSVPMIYLLFLLVKKRVINNHV